MIKCSKLKLDGVLIFSAPNFEDSRGSFSEVFKLSDYRKHLPSETNFIQDNESVSKYGVIRGLHFQKSNFEQAKLVRVSYGEIQDIAVDIRKDSSTFGQYVSVVLSKENRKQLFIPRGFAHGFLVLSDLAIVNYKVDNMYSPEHELGILYSDKEININWDINPKNIIVSKKDLMLPNLSEI